MKNKSNYYGKRKVEQYLHRDQFELYDLENDPDEINNLANNPEYSTVLKRLETKLKAFQLRT